MRIHESCEATIAKHPIPCLGLGICFVYGVLELTSLRTLSRPIKATLYSLPVGLVGLAWARSGRPNESSDSDSDSDSGSVSDPEDPVDRQLRESRRHAFEKELARREEAQRQILAEDAARREAGRAKAREALQQQREASKKEREARRAAIQADERVHVASLALQRATAEAQAGQESAEGLGRLKEEADQAKLAALEAEANLGEAKVAGWAVGQREKVDQWAAREQARLDADLRGLSVKTAAPGGPLPLPQLAPMPHGLGLPDPLGLGQPTGLAAPGWPLPLPQLAPMPHGLSLPDPLGLSQPTGLAAPGGPLPLPQLAPMPGGLELPDPLGLSQPTNPAAPQIWRPHE